jgi:hypothetical protein
VVVYALTVAVVVVALVGVVEITPVAPAGPSTIPTNANVTVRPEAIPKAILRLQRLFTVRSPVQNAVRAPGLWTHLETRFWLNLEAK